MAHSENPDGRGMTVMVASNEAWNLVNFRSGLIRALIAAGHRVIAVSAPDPEMDARLREMGCELAPIPIDAAGISPIRDLATVRAIFAHMRHYRPDAWLSWTIKPNLYGSLAARLAGVTALPNVSGLGTAFIRRSPLTIVVSFLYWACLRRAATVFVQNEADAELLVDNGLVSARQIALVPGSGVDLAHFEATMKLRPPTRHFVMIARMLADKGVREFVGAARLIRRQRSDAQFTLVGPLEVANRTAISREQMEEWVREGVVEYHPAISDVRSMMESADFVVLPSYREGLSRVLLEAAAMGRPVIASDVSGCREVAREGVNGFLCAARSTEALADAMARAADCNDETWYRLSEGARQLAESEYSEKRVIDLYFGALANAGLSGFEPQP